MKTTIYTLALALAAAPVLAVQVEGAKLTLSPAEIQNCTDEGGCMLITERAYQQALARAAAAGAEAGRAVCKATI